MKEEHSHEHMQHIQHMHEDGHMHEHGQPHGHTHSHEETKAVLNRMAKIIGHMQSVKRMVEDDRDCSEVLVQLAAVQSATRSVSKLILKDHMEHCIVDAVKEEDYEALEDLKNAIDKFL